MKLFAPKKSIQITKMHFVSKEKSVWGIVFNKQQYIAVCKRSELLKQVGYCELDDLSDLEPDVVFTLLESCKFIPMKNKFRLLRNVNNRKDVISRMANYSVN